MTKQILFYKPGSLSQKDREKCAKNGLLCIEATDFEAFKLVDPMVPADRKMILKAAVWAISNANTNGNPGPKTCFGAKLAELMDAEMSK